MNLIHVPLEAIRSLPQAERIILRQHVRGGSRTFGYYLEDQTVLDVLERNALPVQVADHKAWNDCELCNPPKVAA